MGPRTVEGKVTASQNAVKHGLLARQDIIIGEDQAEFDLSRDQMLRELAPVGAMESMLVERIVSLSWRLKRAERIQNEVFDTLIDKEMSSVCAKVRHTFVSRSADADAPQETTLGAVAIRDFVNSRVLERMLMYERRIEHSLYRSMAELRKLQFLRQAESTAKPAAKGGRDAGRARESGNGRTGEWASGADAMSNGVTTNVQTSSELADGQLCETNPISTGLEAAMGLVELDAAGG